MNMHELHFLTTLCWEYIIVPTVYLADLSQSHMDAQPIFREELLSVRRVALKDGRLRWLSVLSL